MLQLPFLLNNMFAPKSLPKGIMATIVSFGSFMLFVMNQHNANIINIKNSRSPRLKLTYSRETDQTMPAEGGRVEDLDRCNSKQKKVLADISFSSSVFPLDTHLQFC